MTTPDPRPPSRRRQVQVAARCCWCVIDRLTGDATTGRERITCCHCGRSLERQYTHEPVPREGHGPHQRFVDRTHSWPPGYNDPCPSGRMTWTPVTEE